ncbi:hypothetical protein BD779DRAFT_503083 [Infundibulicybe gibba]|nr:hypothetical protein BD779DRAFT_503083 [Infundibulicybe gibba]
MLYWVQLGGPSQILRLAHLFSIDMAARWRIRRLTIDCEVDFDRSLMLEEPSWDDVESMGTFHWDSSYWGDPQVGYLDESDSDESEDSFDTGHKMDLDQDVAFFASPEGRAREHLIYGGDGELAAAARWPWDVGPGKASAFVSNATSNILHALAPALCRLELISNGLPSATLPTFPQLSVLTIHTTLLFCLKIYPNVLFPALKTLRIQGWPEMGHVDLDSLIYHAPSVALLRTRFDNNLLRDIVERLAIVPPPYSPLPSPKRKFKCLDTIQVAYHPFNSRVIDTRVFGPGEEGLEIFNRSTIRKPKAPSWKDGTTQCLRHDV